MKYTLEERETVLVYDDITKNWKVYSNVPKHIRKFSKLCELDVLDGTIDKPIAIECTLQQKNITFRKPVEYTEEERSEKARVFKERMEKVKKDKSNQ